jgi:anti-sigma regulatory factor (Ser/Thr protein kinase)
VEPVRIIPAHTLILECACDTAAVVIICWHIRRFLAQIGLSDPELDDWELVVTEAANNAVLHVTDRGRLLTVRVEIQASPGSVQVCILDHTPGFDFPTEALLPPVQSERGRGLFLIQRLTDFQCYVRGQGQNCLILRKGRPLCPGSVDLLARTLVEERARLRELQNVVNALRAGGGPVTAKSSTELRVAII